MPGGGLSEGMDHNSVNIREFAHQTLNFIVEALGLKNVDVVAHSMGAHWSTLFAMEHPDKVKKLAAFRTTRKYYGEENHHW